MSLETDLKLLKYKQMVPRYTSYPTAPQFTKDIGDDIFSAWLSEIAPSNDMSVYIHIPFCRQLCWYCGCNTKATLKEKPINDYLQLLFKEITQKTDLLKGRPTVSHIHFGGGSPTILSPDQFTEVMIFLKSKFNINATAEIAIEIDPREISEPKIAAYALAGVNRASLGVQDFHIDVQRAINRVQPYLKVYDTVNLLRDYGIQNISMDLIYGLPYQAVDMMRENIRLALTLKPNRIALFGYAHVPWMKSHMKMIDDKHLPNAKERLILCRTATKALKDKGYKAIGLDHFVLASDDMYLAQKTSTLKRNFQGYTTDTATSLIGFGLSAISDTPSGYVQNISDMRSYAASIKNGHNATAKGVQLTQDDKIRRDIIEQLMCYFKIDLSKFCKDRNINADHFTKEINALQPLENDGFITIDGFKITVQPHARQAIRLVAAAFDIYLKPRKDQHAQVA